MYKKFGMNNSLNKSLWLCLIWESVVISLMTTCISRETSISYQSNVCLPRILSLGTNKELVRRISSQGLIFLSREHARMLCSQGYFCLFRYFLYFKLSIEYLYKWHKLKFKFWGRILLISEFGVAVAHNQFASFINVWVVMESRSWHMTYFIWRLKNHMRV
jgi:hypothetical protein